MFSDGFIILYFVFVFVFVRTIVVCLFGGVILVLVWFFVRFRRFYLCRFVVGGCFVVVFFEWGFVRVLVWGRFLGCRL